MFLLKQPSTAHIHKVIISDCLFVYAQLAFVCLQELQEFFVPPKVIELCTLYLKS